MIAEQWLAKLEAKARGRTVSVHMLPHDVLRLVGMIRCLGDINTGDLCRACIHEACGAESDCLSVYRIAAAYKKTEIHE